MIFMNNRSKFYLAITLLSVGLICSCDHAKPNPREEFVRSLKDADVEGFRFATNEDKNREVTSLTNGTDSEFINLDNSTTSVVLRYTRIKDKSANTTKTYKTEVVKAGNKFEFLVTDIATTEAIIRKAVPENDTTNPPPPPAGCESLESCADFECKNLPALQCEANKTCQPKILSTFCCLNGSPVSIHYLVNPTARLCILKDLIPDIKGFVLRRE